MSTLLYDNLMLHQAVSKGDYEEVRFLLSKNSFDINAVNGIGQMIDDLVQPGSEVAKLINRYRQFLRNKVRTAS